MDNAYMFNSYERRVVTRWILSLPTIEHYPYLARLLADRILWSGLAKYKISIDAYLDLRVLYHNSIYERIEREGCNLDIAVAVRTMLRKVRRYSCIKK